MQAVPGAAARPLEAAATPVTPVSCQTGKAAASDGTTNARLAALETVGSSVSASFPHFSFFPLLALDSSCSTSKISTSLSSLAAITSEAGRSSKGAGSVWPGQR